MRRFGLLICFVWQFGANVFAQPNSNESGNLSDQWRLDSVVVNCFEASTGLALPGNRYVATTSTAFNNLVQRIPTSFDFMAMKATLENQEGSQQWTIDTLGKNIRCYRILPLEQGNRGGPPNDSLVAPKIPQLSLEKISQTDSSLLTELRFFYNNKLYHKTVMAVYQCYYTKALQ